MTKYATVRIPQDMANRADAFIGVQGFTSRADIVNEALRDFFTK
jgi:metal-responsive CopG/Arc/MetJ family transcriptional regulator